MFTVLSGGGGKFQSTLPRGERLFRLAVDGRIYPISIHAPARGATNTGSIFIISIFHFNPRSREGSDRRKPAGVTGCKISIHAPARGATFLHMVVVFLLQIFQSTLPRGERHALLRQVTSYVVISIHAPARGATHKNLCIMRLIDFNPRSREGSDSEYKTGFLEVNPFQSTLPRGERLGNAGTQRLAAGFQSTLPRGERHYCHPYRSCERDFNPRSREGSDIEGWHAVRWAT